jgi:hypothetical protein
MGLNGKKICIREEKKLSRLLIDYGRTWPSEKMAVMKYGSPSTTEKQTTKISNRKIQFQGSKKVKIPLLGVSIMLIYFSDIKRIIHYEYVHPELSVKYSSFRFHNVYDSTFIEKGKTVFSIIGFLILMMCLAIQKFQ